MFAAHALCLTAAFELSLGCDLLLAAESARFGLVETVVGLTPAMGGTQRLAERAGPARARELVMTGELYDAATLERWNVVNRVLPDAGFDEAARAFALRLAHGPTRAHAATKAIVRAGLEGGGARAADERVPELAGDLFATEDLQRRRALVPAARARPRELRGALSGEGHERRSSMNRALATIPAKYVVLAEYALRSMDGVRLGSPRRCVNWAWLETRPARHGFDDHRDRSSAGRRRAVVLGGDARG